MAFVYLISESNDSNLFKIGATNKSNIDERRKELQTGNPSELNIIDYFETSHPYKIEKMMHNHFRNVNELNEWFYLEKSDVDDFKKLCQYYQTIVDSLAENPFFK